MNLLSSLIIWAIIKFSSASINYTISLPTNDSDDDYDYDLVPNNILDFDQEEEEAAEISLRKDGPVDFYEQSPWNSMLGNFSRFVELDILIDREIVQTMKDWYNTQDNFIAISKFILNTNKILYQLEPNFTLIIKRYLIKDQVTFYHKAKDAVLWNVLGSLAKKQRDISADLKILFSERDTQQIGRSELRSVCVTRKQQILSRIDFNETISTFILARHIATAFGVKEDGDSCECIYCIMAAEFKDVKQAQFSKCSKDQFAAILKEFVPICLKNTPRKSWDPVCGNGLLEAGEQCDCVDYNCRKCCTNTCKLALHATCGSGPCCSSFRCRPYSKEDQVPCRPARETCDLPEACDGSGECPLDKHRRDGSECSDALGMGYCFKGVCGHTNRGCNFMSKSLTGGSKSCYEANLKDPGFTCGPTIAKSPHRVKPRRCHSLSKFCGFMYCKESFQQDGQEFEKFLRKNYYCFRIANFYPNLLFCQQFTHKRKSKKFCPEIVSLSILHQVIRFYLSIRLMYLMAPCVVMI